MKIAPFLMLICCLLAQLGNCQTYVQDSKLLDPFPNTYDRIGKALAADGRFLAVGAPEDDRDENELNQLQDAGAVLIYRKIGNNYQFHQKITSPFRYQYLEYGHEIAISGDYMVVGIPWFSYDINNANYDYYTGLAAVYKWNDLLDLWELDTLLSRPAGRLNSAQFGSSVAIEGARIVIGCIADNFDENELNYKPQSGAVYVYDLNAGTWNFTQKLVAHDRIIAPAFGGQQFGHKISLHGQHLVVTSISDYMNLSGTIDAQYCGSAYTFWHDGTTYLPKNKLISPWWPNRTVFGKTVSLHGNHLFVGDPLENDEPSGTQLDGAGAVYAYEYNGTNWNIIDTLVAPTRYAWETYGESVCFKNDTLIVGVPGHSYGSLGYNNNTGAAYVYVLNGSQLVNAEKLQSIDQSAMQQKGGSVTFESGKFFLGSAPNSTDVNGDFFITELGAVYVFKQGCNSFSTINATSCTNYESPSGNYLWVNNGTYLDTIPNAAGCDSIITINLTLGSAYCNTCIIGEYPLNNNVDDISGLGHHGTNGAAVSVNDRFGNANSSYQTAATAAGLSLGSYPSYEFETSNFTINLWVKKLAPTDGSGNQEYAIGAWDDNSMLGDNEWVIRLTDISMSNVPSFRVEDNVGNMYQVSSGLEMNLQEWYMITAQRDADFIKIYINGQLMGSANIGTSMTLNNKGLPITLGASSSSQYGTDAVFDDVKIFNCALTPSQVDSIYQAENPITPCDLAIYGSSESHPICHNGNDGTIQVSTTGGTGNITFSWNTGQTGSYIQNLSPGTYTLVVSDDIGCATMASYTINNPDPINLIVSTSLATCGQADGSANISVTNGAAPYIYQWSSGDTLANAANLAAGHYMVSVYDSNGCYGAEMFGISNVGGPQLFFSANNETCPGNSDGAINLIVGTGTGPFTFEWSNGETSEDLSQVTAGHYDVLVTDANGCITIDFVEVESSPAIDLSNYTFTTASCGQNDGGITVNGTGGYGILDYSWNTGATGNSISGIGAGAYYVTAIDGHGCSKTVGIMLNNASGPGVSVQSITPIDCNGNGGNVDVNVNSGIPPFTYNWNNGAYTTQDLNGVTAGNYDLYVTGNDGCTTMLQVNVPGLMPVNPGICIVSVDTTTITNLVIWEKPASANGIHYYSIYREGSAAGVYTKVDTVHYNNLSQWTDPTANPRVRSWRYRISATDSCGVESMLSPVHKTVHLTISPGVGQNINLIWDNYVGESFPTWFINRWHATTGWVEIDAIPSTLQSYTDFNLPAQGGFVDYSIEGGPINCTATRAINHNTTRSNKQNNVAPPNNVPETLIISLGAYPNPTNNDITISGMFAHDLGWSISITDLTGRVVMENINGRGSEIRQTINLQQLATGMYQLRLTGDGLHKTMQIVKQ